MKMMQKFTPLLLIWLILINGCKKDSESYTFNHNAGYGNTIVTTVMGVVTTSQGNPMVNCKVMIGSQITSTDNFGIYIFNDIAINSEREIVTCFIGDTLTKGFLPMSGVNYVNFHELNQLYTVYNFNSANASNLISPFGVEITIPPNSLVDMNSGNLYNGNYTLNILYVNPDSANFNTLCPGGDLLTNDNRILYSYGMMDVTMFSISGKRLQLASGANATLKFPIASSQIASAPPVIPTWHYNTETAFWEEEGSAIKTGNHYVFNVPHFSWWNCDVPFEKAYITGSVKDCNNAAVPNAVVSVNNMYTLTTGANGVYASWVPAFIPLSFQVLPFNNPLLTTPSNLVNVSSLSSGQTYHVPDLNVTCTGRITGSILDCDGIPTHSIVFYQYNGIVLVYNINSNYEIPVPSNTNLTLYYLESNGMMDTTILTTSSGTVIDMGTISLCETNISIDSLPDNSFVIIGGPWNNQLFLLDTTTFSAGINALSPGLDMEIGDQFMPVYFTLHIPDYTTPGIYSMSNLSSCYLQIANVSNLNIQSSTFINAEIKQFDAVGGRIKLEVEGNDLAADGLTGAIYRVNYRGKINIRRTH